VQGAKFDGVSERLAEVEHFFSSASPAVDAYKATFIDAKYMHHLFLQEECWLISPCAL
jgi:hypothetical protein